MPIQILALQGHLFDLFRSSLPQTPSIYTKHTRTAACVHVSVTKTGQAALGLRVLVYFGATCAREQPQEVGRSSVNKQHTFRETLHSPEHRFRADVENNGHF